MMRLIGTVVIIFSLEVMALCFCVWRIGRAHRDLFVVFHIHVFTTYIDDLRRRGDRVPAWERQSMHNVLRDALANIKPHDKSAYDRLAEIAVKNGIGLE